MSKEIIDNIIVGTFLFLPYIIIIIATILIVRAIKKHNQRKFELEKYKAETERMKAEAMRDEAARRQEEGK